jgi:cytochrome c biogenesis factor
MVMHDNPIATVGQAGLLLALIASAWAVGASVAGARRGNRKLTRSGVLGAHAATALTSFASGVMFFLLLANDYSVKYV